MSNEEAIANLNMISVAFVEPVTKEQRKLIDDTFEVAIQALEQQKRSEHQEILISLKDLAEFWDDFVCAHYFAEEEDRLSQDDLMDELGIAFQDRFPKEYNEYRRKVILGIEE